MLDNPFDDGFNSGSKKKTLRVPVSRSQKNEILARQGNRCAKCLKDLDMRATHFDHIKEVYKGGKSTINNLQALCSNCHSIKTHNNNLKQVEKRNSKLRNHNLFEFNFRDDFNFGL